MKTLSVAVVGCGARGSAYLNYLSKSDDVDLDLRAVADADPEIRAGINTIYAEGRAREYDDGPSLIEAHRDELDGVIVATPNDQHTASALAAMAAGLPLLMEKPVATRLDDLASVWQQSRQYDARMVVGFVLRFTPFYRKVHELVGGGALGQVLAIHGEELMADRLTALFFRGTWRVDPERSGGLMLEKCCHDIDILNWLAGGRAQSVTSAAARSFIHPIEGAAARCRACPLADSCRFEQTRIMQSFRQASSAEHFDFMAARRSDDRCVYAGTDAYPDHQTLTITYDNGVLATFTVAMGQPRNQRTLHILGTDARLEGALEENEIRLYRRVGPNNEEFERIALCTDGTGHGGGDGVLVADMIDLFGNGPDRQRPALREGVESAMLCLLADRAWKQGERIDIEPVRKEIFGG